MNTMFKQSIYSNLPVYLMGEVYRSAAAAREIRSLRPTMRNAINVCTKFGVKLNTSYVAHVTPQFFENRRYSAYAILYGALVHSHQNDTQRFDLYELAERINRAGGVDVIRNTIASIDFEHLRCAHGKFADYAHVPRHHDVWAERVYEYMNIPKNNALIGGSLSVTHSHTLEINEFSETSNWVFTPHRARIALNQDSEAREIRDALKRGWIEIIFWLDGYRQNDTDGMYQLWDTRAPVKVRVYFEPR